jgi:hypothetical protein
MGLNGKSPQLQGMIVYAETGLAKGRENGSGEA